MASLYNLASSYLTVYQMDDIEEEAWMDTLDSIDEAIEDKADNIARLIRSIEADAAALKAEKDAFAKKQKAAENKIARLKEYLQDNMERTGKTKFKTSLFAFNLQNNPASLVIPEGEDIPYEWLVVKKEPNKAVIKAALKDGVELPFKAELKQTQSLRIR